MQTGNFTATGDGTTTSFTTTVPSGTYNTVICHNNTVVDPNRVVVHIQDSYVSGTTLTCDIYDISVGAVGVLQTGYTLIISYLID
jgi:hypothetical protein